MGMAKVTAKNADSTLKIQPLLSHQLCDKFLQERYNHDYYNGVAAIVLAYGLRLLAAHYFD